MGLIYASHACFSMIGSFLASFLSSRFGRKPILLVEILGGCIGTVFLGFANSILTITLARSFAGFFGGTVGLGQSVILDLTTKDNRGKYMGIFGALLGLGFVCGPAVGAILGILFIYFMG